jgi:AraC-like DNA-binding protein
VGLIKNKFEVMSLGHVIRGNHESKFNVSERIPPNRHLQNRPYAAQHANLGDEVSVSALAQEVGLSEAHFARLFRATFGEPQTSAVLRWRLERAARLIRLRLKLGLADAAVAVGFYDQPHMTHAARRHFGTSPASWLKL